ncbi:MAG: hypothetical protein WA354_09020 [Terracidiphilus sp.]
MPHEPKGVKPLLADELTLAKSERLRVTKGCRQKRLNARRRDRIILENKFDPFPASLQYAVVPITGEAEARRVLYEPKALIVFRQHLGELESAV